MSNLIKTRDGMRKRDKRGVVAGIEIKVNSGHAVYRSAFTLFAKCQFIAHSVFNYCR